MTAAKRRLLTQPREAQSKMDTRELTRELTLQDLILTLKGDRTYLGLEEATGGVVKAQRWNQITNGIRVSEFPEPRTIEAMARALNVNVTVLVLAFAKAVGLDVDRNQSVFADLLPPMVATLTDKQQAALLGIIRSMNDGQPDDDDGEADDESDSPKPPQPQPRRGKPQPKAPRLRDLKKPRTDLPPMMT